MATFILVWPESEYTRRRTMVVQVQASDADAFQTAWGVPVVKWIE